jgi:YD repeat-containing protein
MVYDRVVRLPLRIPMARADLLALIHREGKVISQTYDGNDALVEAVVPRRLAARFNEFRAAPAPSEVPTNV